MLSMSRKMTKAFTALELLVVIIIIGILATLSLPNLRKMKEKSYDNEAKATLKLLQAAEKIYYMQNGFYYPYSGAVDHNSLNTYLKVFLPTSSNVHWAYSTTTGTGAATASRSPSGRRWSIAITAEEPTCTSLGGDNCIP
jgi:prepilin-type N-terminal cleavage/methylation domain-containing protein